MSKIKNKNNLKSNFKTKYLVLLLSNLKYFFNLSNSSSLPWFIISLSLIKVGILSFGSQVQRDIYCKMKKIFFKKMKNKNVLMNILIIKLNLCKVLLFDI